MTPAPEPPPPEPEALALLLREAHPQLQPLELDADTAARLIGEAGGDGEDDALVAAVLVAWEELL